jgi:DNA-binding MarR family transcriptional regulator
MSNRMRLLAKKTDAGLSSTAKFVLITLADYHNNKTGKCYPSHTTVANDTNLTRETVARNIKILVRKGLISTANRNGGQNSKYITFHLEQSQSNVTENHNTNVTGNHNGIVTENEGIVTENHRHCDSKAKHCDGESHEQLNNITKRTKHNRGNSQTNAQFDGLEKWLCVYPKKGNRKAIEREWKRINPDVDVLIADTKKRIANDRRWQDGARYAWSPENYLRDEHYNDPIEPVRKSEAEPSTMLPHDDQALESWAVAQGIHERGNAPLGIDYSQYRQWLQQYIQQHNLQIKT